MVPEFTMLPDSMDMPDMPKTLSVPMMVPVFVMLAFHAVTAAPNISD
jgi:hypothetical protein